MNSEQGKLELGLYIFLAVEGGGGGAPYNWMYSLVKDGSINGGGDLISGSYYMASSVSRQDDPNRTLWLATRAGKMLGTLAVSRKKAI